MEGVSSKMCCLDCGSRNIGEIPEEIPNLPVEVWTLIATHLSLADLKNFRLVSKLLQTSSISALNKISIIHLDIPLRKNFIRDLRNFCKNVYPILTKNSSTLKISINAFRPSRHPPDENYKRVIKTVWEQSVHVFDPNRNMNLFVNVTAVFTKFVGIEINFGIRKEWHVSQFVELWNSLLASSHLEWVKIVFTMSEEMDAVLAEGLDGMRELENVKTFTFGYFVGVRWGLDKVNRDKVFRKLLSKFPNAEKVEDEKQFRRSSSTIVED